MPVLPFTFVALAYAVLWSYLILRWQDPRILLDHYIGAGEPPVWSNEMWWYSLSLFDLGTNPMHSSHLFYPFYWGSIDSSLVFFLLIPITATLGPVAAYNIHLLFSFAGAGFSMFLLARHFLRDDPAAFLAGIIYTFCAHHFAHGWSHLHIYANYWLPAP